MNWGKAIFLALILSLIFRTFLFQSYMVVSSNMDKTLLIGDRIFTNKINFGPRLPISILTIPFYPQLYSRLVQLPYYRIKGFESVKRNQLILINKPVNLKVPIDKKPVYVTRCIGLPGDTLTIKNKDVYLNGEFIKPPKSAQFRYRVITSNQSKSESNNQLGIIDTLLCEQQLKNINKSNSTRFVSKLSNSPGARYENYFPSSHSIRWNADYFGPIVVPHKGQLITLTPVNYAIYKDIIIEYENNSVELHGSEYYINNKLTNTYTIQNDYYFALNDNRSQSNDSRQWGFIPKTHIIGEATFCWLSIDKKDKKIRWDRIGRLKN